jgi:type III secretion system low calcium response chaperone LcrH/SycD
MREKIDCALPFSELRNIDSETLQNWYEIAIELLAKRRFVDGADAFFFLSVVNPYVSSFWVGLGMAEQSQMRYEKAIEAYMMAGVTNPHDPLAFFYNAKCYAALGRLEDADRFLEMARDCERHGKVSLPLLRSIEEARVFIKKANE